MKKNFGFGFWIFCEWHLG